MRNNDSSLILIGNNHLVDYPTPASISYGYGFGSLAGMALLFQVITGVFLGMHYTAEIYNSFVSIDVLMRETWGGWLIRYYHSNGASLFFIVVYLHIIRGLYYGSYIQPRGALWGSGVFILLIMIITAFLGYVLPWGQMSLWGATVITNLLSAIPFVGNSLVIWLWGGYSVGASTLLRFYSLHFLFPFIILGAVLLHLGLLHINGSSNRLGVEDKSDKLVFYPYCVVKDLLVLLVLLVSYALLVVLVPNVLGHSDNSIQANAMFTPAHIVPEWYFLPFYGILRSVPYKLGGVILMLFSILGLLLLPGLANTGIRSNRFKPFGKLGIWFFIGCVLMLGYLGQEVVAWPFDFTSKVVSLGYFVIILGLLPRLI